MHFKVRLSVIAFIAGYDVMHKALLKPHYSSIKN